MSTPLTAFLVSVSPEDDAAFTALHDLALILAGHHQTAVVGGQMVGLLMAAFPSEGLVDRRTNDADGGIPTALAADGSIHDDLLAAEYKPVGGNRYVKPGNPAPTIDLLVPSLNGHFRPEWRGGRQIDAMPGLNVALSSTLDIAVESTLRDGAVLAYTAKTPTVEAAVILKSIAYSSRSAHTVKDLIDLSNLFHVLAQHGVDAVGGWRLDAAGASGSRGDAALILTELAVKLESGRVRSPRVDGRRLAFLIRKHVAARN